MSATPPKKSSTSFLDAKLFGHIHNDPNLQGSTIQGGDMSVSMKYLDHFIEDFGNGTIPITGLTPLKEKNIMKNCCHYKRNWHNAKGYKIKSIYS